MRALLFLGAFLLLGCTLDGEGKQAARNDAAPSTVDAAGQASPWLNPRAQIVSQQRVAAPAQMDIRQALYFKAPDSDSLGALLRLRDYSAESSGAPDPQHLLLLLLDEGTSTDCGLESELAIYGLQLNPQRTVWLACALDLAAAEAAVDAPARLICSAEESSRDEFLADQRLLPLGFAGERAVTCRAVRSFQVDNGLLAPALDWRSPALRYNLATQQADTDEAGLFLPAADLRQLAGYQIEYTPVLPADARISYFVAKADSPAARRLAQFSYHVSYSAFQWRPPLLWVSPDLLATVQFLPDTAGVSAQPNHLGLFRLVVLNTLDQQVTLLEDHLPAGMPVAADGGVLFFTIQQYEQGEARWALWASSADGLLKQRLWQPDRDTVYLAVEDAAAGRLLVNRQYFEPGGQRPRLTSELREFSLEPLAGGEVKLDIASPGPLPPVKSSPGEPEADQPRPDVDSELPPLTIPE